MLYTTKKKEGNKGMEIWVVFLAVTVAYRSILGILLGVGVMWLLRQEEKEEAAGLFRSLRQKVYRQE